MITNFIPGSKHIIHIDSINSRGEGVGRINGWVIFVANGVPGDEIEIKIISSKKNYSKGEIITFIRPSPHRTDPLCEYSGYCGGCSFQNITYNYQLHLKEELLRENLKKIGNIPPEFIKPIIPSPNIWNYRNKVQYVISKSKQGNIKLGFFRRDSHDVINIRKCPIEHDLSNNLIERIYPLLSDWSIYNEKRGTGLLRNIICKTSFFYKEILCILVTGQKEIPYKVKEKFLENLKTFPGLVGIVQNFNPSLTNVVMGEENFTLWGRDYILEEIKGLKFMISSSSFFQVNPVQVEKMYDILSNFISPDINQVIDAYCGIGTFSLFLGDKVKYVFGIEENKEAVNKAIENMTLNNISNMQFLAGQVEKLLYTLADGKNIDLIILDPPRKGCEKSVLDAIRKLQIKHIVYISCNSATLARDLEILKSLDYKIELIQPIDMFPHTPHVESMSKLILI